MSMHSAHSPKLFFYAALQSVNKHVGKWFLYSYIQRQPRQKCGSLLHTMKFIQT